MYLDDLLTINILVSKTILSSCIRNLNLLKIAPGVKTLLAGLIEAAWKRTDLWVQMKNDVFSFARCLSSAKKIPSLISAQLPTIDALFVTILSLWFCSDKNWPPSIRKNNAFPPRWIARQCSLEFECPTNLYICICWLIRPSNYRHIYIYMISVSWDLRVPFVHFCFVDMW